MNESKKTKKAFAEINYGGEEQKNDAAQNPEQNKPTIGTSGLGLFQGMFSGASSTQQTSEPAKPVEKEEEVKIEKSKEDPFQELEANNKSTEIKEQTPPFIVNQSPESQH